MQKSTTYRFYMDVILTCITSYKHNFTPSTQQQKKRSGTEKYRSGISQGTKNPKHKTWLFTKNSWITTEPYMKQTHETESIDCQQHTCSYFDRSELFWLNARSQNNVVTDQCARSENHRESRIREIIWNNCACLMT